jgi:hypothetical protein
MGKKAFLKDFNPYRVINTPANNRIAENTATAIEYSVLDIENLANMYRKTPVIVMVIPGKMDGVLSAKKIFLFLISRKALIRGIRGIWV